MKKMHRRGIRVLIGGDYGFAWTPMGTNAKDLELFVNLLGFSPMEAIRAATAYGGQIMGLGNELGLIREGYLADLLLVDGDPASDVRVLQDKSRLVAIMKDGRFHKAPNGMAADLRLTAWGCRTHRGAGVIPTSRSPTVPVATGTAPNARAQRPGTGSSSARTNPHQRQPGQHHRLRQRDLQMATSSRELVPEDQTASYRPLAIPRARSKEHTYELHSL